MVAHPGTMRLTILFLIVAVPECAATRQSPLFVGLTTARVSEPVKVSNVLRDLSLDSVNHWHADIASLNLDEKAEMIVALQGNGIALGDRSRLRRFIDSEERAVIDLIPRPADVFPRRLQGNSEDKGSVSGGARTVGISLALSA